jgi:hypothetical protein
MPATEPGDIKLTDLYLETDGSPVAKLALEQGKQIGVLKSEIKRLEMTIRNLDRELRRAHTKAAMTAKR